MFVIAFVTGSKSNLINSAQFNVAVHNYCGIIIVAIMAASALPDVVVVLRNMAAAVVVRGH